MNYKKIILLTSTVIIALSGIYFTIHTYAYNKVRNQYAKDFEKTPLGDYALNKDDKVLALAKASLFNSYTNLSLHTDNTSLIVWVPLYGGELTYGLVINDDVNKISHQIETNSNLEAFNNEDQAIIDHNQEKIAEIKSTLPKAWINNL